MKLIEESRRSDGTMKRSKKCQLQPEVISGSRAKFESHF